MMRVNCKAVSLSILSILLLGSTYASLSFAAQVKQSPAEIQISRAIIGFLVSKDASYSGKKISVSFKYADKVLKDLSNRKGNVKYVVAEMYPDYKPIGNIIVPIQVIVDDVPKEKVFLRTKVSVLDKIVVANKRYKKGDILASPDIVIEERDIAALSSSVITDITCVEGMESKTFIPLGNPVYDWMIKKKSYVKKNEKIKMLANSENVIVEAQGIALEDGFLGQEIAVKNLSSNKELVGVVTATGEVQVK